MWASVVLSVLCVLCWWCGVVLGDWVRLGGRAALEFKSKTSSRVEEKTEKRGPIDWFGGRGTVPAPPLDRARAWVVGVGWTL